jgi:hypothetical protein
MRDSQWEQIHCLYKALTKPLADKNNSTVMKGGIFLFIGLRNGRGMRKNGREVM